MNADLDVLLDTALDVGLPDHVLVSLARVVNLMWLQDRRSVALPVMNLMAYLGIESRNTLDAHLKAYARVPGLTVKKASGHVLIHYRPPRDERAMAAQQARSPVGASDTASMIVQSLPNSHAVAAQASHDEERGAQSAPNERAVAAQWLLNERAMTAPRGVTAAQSAPNDRVMAAQWPRNERAVSAQSVPNGRAMVARSAMDEASVEAFLEALRELGNGRPVFGGREISRGDVRAVLEAASRQGYSLDLVLAKALALEEEFRRKGKAMDSPVGLLRHWVARSDLAEHVPYSLQQEARKILGLEEGENESDGGESVAVEIVGDPPYDPAQVWHQVKERLREEMEGREYNTWLRDARLLAWQDGEFVVGVPNVLVRDWVSKRLNGHVSRVLAQFAGLKEGDVSVRYVVAPIR